MEQAHAEIILTLALFCATHADPTVGQAPKSPAPASLSATVADSDLRDLVSEQSRIVVVTDESDVHWAVRASSASQVGHGSLDLPAGTQFIMLANQVVVVGGDRRVPSARDLLEAARENWREPFEVGSTQMFWDYAGRQPAEMIQFLKSTLKKPMTLELKRVVGWWCPSSGPECHDPKQ